MASLARRNLFHDKVRLAVTLTGIVFAVVLITVQLGLFAGFATPTSNVIDHASADLRIAAKGLRNFDQAAPFSERKLYQALATDGVARAEKRIIQFSRLKRADVDEMDVSRIRLNQRAYVTADAYAGKKFWGRAVRIGQAPGRKNVRTDEPGERVDTKILETLIELDAGRKLPAGLRVDSFIITDESLQARSEQK